MKNRLNRPRYTRRSSTLLAVYFFVALIIPNIVLLYTEPYSIWSAEASLLMPGLSGQYAVAPRAV